MKSAILDDAQAIPGLFVWNGPIELGKIEEWVGRRGWAIPQDLVAFWAMTGGGEILESERFLPPLSSPGGEEPVAEVTAWYRDRGLPAGLVVFHEGLGFTAVRCADGVYLSLDDQVRVCDEFGSLNDWYMKILRAEYAARYSLPPLRYGY